MKIYLKTILILAIFVVIPCFDGSVFAASLKFDKTTATAANGATFQISVIVDPGSDKLRSAEAYVTFDSSLLKATAVSAGSLFPDVSNDISTTGKVWIAGMVSDPASSISTSGTLATITFQGLKEGTGTLAFDCSQSKIINDDIVNVPNVLVCSQNGTAAVTVGSGGSNPQPTTPPSNNNTNNSNTNELPQSGIFENVSNIAIPGMILLILGGVLKLVL